VVARQSTRGGEFDLAVAWRGAVGRGSRQHGVLVGAAALEDGDEPNFRCWATASRDQLASNNRLERARSCLRCDVAASCASVKSSDELFRGLPSASAPRGDETGLVRPGVHSFSLQRRGGRKSFAGGSRSRCLRRLGVGRLDSVLDARHRRARSARCAVSRFVRRDKCAHVCAAQRRAGRLVLLVGYQPVVADDRRAHDLHVALLLWSSQQQTRG